MRAERSVFKWAPHIIDQIRALGHKVGSLLGQAKARLHSPGCSGRGAAAGLIVTLRSSTSPDLLPAQAPAFASHEPGVGLGEA